ncbi:MAG: hypothetical protein OEN01_02660 [Candidatus Krumholzibacteria bacterium]|nr:hypothetical protein [Candidatus Krumholzibacteria bacterium]
MTRTTGNGRPSRPWARRSSVTWLALMVWLGALMPFVIDAAALAQTRSLGILGEKAPPWDVHSWIDAEGKDTEIALEDYQGKVVYLLCFQSW